MTCWFIVFTVENTHQSEPQFVCTVTGWRLIDSEEVNKGEKGRLSTVEKTTIYSH